MRMKYILHIGPIKTGTDSIQYAFRSSEKVLRQYGIAYPGHKWGGTAQHNLAHILSGLDPQKVGLPKNWEERFHAETADADICVVSSESFSNFRDVSLVTSLFPPSNTMVVIYIREPVSHTASWYRQNIFGSNLSTSFQEFAEHHRLPFSDLANRWAKAYGRENVILRKYGREFLLYGDVVTDFAHLIRPELVDVFGKNTYTENPGIAGNLLFIKRVLNCFISIEECVSIISELKKIRLMESHFNGKIPVDQETASRIAFLSRKQLDVLEKQFGLFIEPQVKPIEAPATPDYDMLQNDFRKILDEARKNKWNIATLMERYFSIFTI